MSTALIKTKNYSCCCYIYYNVPAILKKKQRKKRGGASLKWHQEDMGYKNDIQASWEEVNRDE